MIRKFVNVAVAVALVGLIIGYWKLTAYLICDIFNFLDHTCNPVDRFFAPLLVAVVIPLGVSMFLGSLLALYAGAETIVNKTIEMKQEYERSKIPGDPNGIIKRLLKK